jgi:outer membrane cobalamin receptor
VVAANAWGADATGETRTTSTETAPALEAKLDALVVTAMRTPQPAERVAVTTHVFDAAALRTAPTVTVDSALRQLPSFSLFRRSDSLTANPTTQGVSLRGLGPSGASRSLVLLDGVPLNDPFGGWVNWGQVPRDAIDRIEVVPGGGATAWGNAALAGVVQVLLRPPGGAMTRVDPAADRTNASAPEALRLTLSAGAFGTRTGSALVEQDINRTGSLQLMGEDFVTTGFNTVAPERRGPIDQNAWSRHRSFGARWRGSVSAATEVSVLVRGFEEFRGNGTPYQRNGTRAKQASVQATGQPGEAFSWNAAAYAQQQSYASTFSAVNATRTAETPASDQFAVPATALGASWTGHWVSASHATGAFGADVRSVHGETRENYSYASGSYTRERVAGGSQEFAGLFLLGQQAFGSLQTSAGARLDQWTEAHGHRRERLRSTGALTRNDAYPDRHDTEFSPSLGASWNATPTWRFKADAQHAFRRPTLNELYRPFRQGANVVEANENLRTEHVDSAEVGAEWTVLPAPERNHAPDHNALTGKPARDARLTLGATAFWNDLQDAVTNVTLARGPGTFPLFGTLPAGGIGRQRLNVDRVRVQGLELSAHWIPTHALSVTAAYLYDDATVRRAVNAPTLIGHRLPEVPRQAATVAAAYHAPANLTLTARLRWIGRQYDDDENTLRLGEAVITDLGVGRPLTSHLELFALVENAGNARIETARSTEGVVSLGTPRLWMVGVRGRF